MGDLLLRGSKLPAAEEAAQEQVARLRELARELSEIAEVMENVRDVMSAPLKVTDESRSRRIPRESTIIEAQARSLLWLAEMFQKARKTRNECFPDGIFGETAWEILLDLFIWRLRGKRLSVTGALQGTTCPMTTGLRWLRVLERHNLIERERSVSDARRTWIDLTTDGYTRMARFLLKWGADLARLKPIETYERAEPGIDF